MWGVPCLEISVGEIVQVIAGALGLPYIVHACWEQDCPSMALALDGTCAVATESKAAALQGAACCSSADWCWGTGPAAGSALSFKHSPSCLQMSRLRCSTAAFHLALQLSFIACDVLPLSAEMHSKWRSRAGSPFRTKAVPHTRDPVRLNCITSVSTAALALGRDSLAVWAF